MKLYDYLQLTKADTEITVYDSSYDIEVYFSKIELKDMDKWDIAMENLSRKLNITEISDCSVSVDLSELIEKNIKKLEDAELFIDNDIDDIMDDVESILSGNVSEKWLENFVDLLR